ncbi:MAG: hypothetical protein AB1404_12410, partial [Spirochaetota bacterium]
MFPLFSTPPLTTAPPAQGPRFLRLWVMVAGGAPWAGFTGMGGGLALRTEGPLCSLCSPRHPSPLPLQPRGRAF